MPAHTPPNSPAVTAAAREAAFRKAIEDVCLEHGAELYVTDDGKPYGMANGVLEVTMPAIYDGDNLTMERHTFNW